MVQVRTTDNQLGSMQMMQELSEHLEMNYPEIPDPIYMDQPVKVFITRWDVAGFVENLVSIDKDEDFSKSLTPQNSPPRPALRSIGNLQNTTAARELFDNFFLNNSYIIFVAFSVVN